MLYYNRSSESQGAVNGLGDVQRQTQPVGLIPRLRWYFIRSLAALRLNIQSSQTQQAGFSSLAATHMWSGSGPFGPQL